MSRLLPHPVVSLGLFLFWMLAQESAAPGPALVGLVLAVLGGWALAMLKPGRVRLRRPLLALRLFGTVTYDVIRSNIDVARIILLRLPARRAGFMRIRLELRQPEALAVLACILTATPGTAWVEFDAEEGWLLLHVLDLVDEEHWVRIVKDRYEAPLREIFR
ncbi:Na+/H+ antiporter subunit E [Pseudoroseomonas cervicalis]|uniref:Na+/H+ antiporter subunit E n=1 Tax=Teichococcus cervicalis TaxID=204525 RepID=UPI00277D32F5|nr:Na+/H+ antiporter subunit E [Pseudoroseomonas cervicalis]MDQ1077807.1 multicomponent K+:H+ antiporter subunit E [Pseudoroseomonas cervicalis]